MLHFRFAKKEDIDIYFKWLNDPLVRKYSYKQDLVLYEDHLKWFNSKISNIDFSFYLFFNEDNIPVGQVRIQKDEKETTIGISIDAEHRGKSYGKDMLVQSTNHYLDNHTNSVIKAYIKKDNIASYNIFKKAGFFKEENVIYNGIESFCLSKYIII